MEPSERPPILPDAERERRIASLVRELGYTKNHAAVLVGLDVGEIEEFDLDDPPLARRECLARAARRVQGMR